ncbi:T9SS type A sorting domain-containing protein [Flavobacterium sp. 3HN19-14]|uniref:T9SS type A sorting domain-containing protein n=1 Tax=Flavobacterium sp. 3HN19-14 TaxID=3448133 RepID=UPI003EE0F2C2
MSNWGRYDVAFGNDIDFDTTVTGWSANGATTYSIGLSVRDHYFADDLKVAPNPTKGVLNLNNLSGQKIEMMKIINATGQVIQTYDGFYNTIDLSGLASGIYFLQLSTADASAIKRIVVQ